MGMTLFVKEKVFCAAHHLEGHPICGGTHGHNFEVTVGFSSTSTYRDNPVLDFKNLSEMVDKVLQIFDHVDLGDRCCEELVADIFVRLKAELARQTPENLVKVKFVDISETPKFGARIENE